MDAFGTYLAMGGYAAFVWPAFILSTVVLVGVFVISHRRLRASEAALADLVDTEPRST